MVLTRPRKRREGFCHRKPMNLSVLDELMIKLHEVCATQLTSQPLGGGGSVQLGGGPPYFL